MNMQGVMAKEVIKMKMLLLVIYAGIGLVVAYLMITKIAPIFSGLANHLVIGG